MTDKQKSKIELTTDAQESAQTCPSEPPAVVESMGTSVPSRAKASDWRRNVALYGQYLIAVVVLVLAIASSIKPSAHSPAQTVLSSKDPDAILAAVSQSEQEVSASLPLRSSDAPVRMASQQDEMAQTAKHLLVKMGPSVIPKLVHHLERYQYVDSPRTTSSTAVAEMVLAAFPDQSVDPLIQSLKSNSSLLDSEQMDAFLLLGEPAMNRMVEMLVSKNEQDEKTALAVLSRIADSTPADRDEVKAHWQNDQGSGVCMFVLNWQQQCDSFRFTAEGEAKIQEALDKTSDAEQREALVGLLGRCSPSAKLIHQLCDIGENDKEKHDLRVRAYAALCDLYARNGGLADRANAKDSSILPLATECRKVLEKARTGNDDAIKNAISRIDAKLSGRHLQPRETDGEPRRVIME